MWMMVFLQTVMSLAFSIMQPFLPLYVAELGVHSASALDVWSGVLTSVSFITAALVSPFWGALADARGRKLMVVRSAAAVTVFTGLMGLVWNVWQLFVLRTLMGAFSGFFAAAVALVGSEVPDDQLGYALGWLQSGSFAGVAIGPLIGGVLADLFHSYRVVFFATSGLALVVTVLTVILVAETYVPKAGRKIASRNIFAGFAGIGRSSPVVLVMLVALFTAQLGSRVVAPIVTLFVRDLVGGGAALATLAGLATAVTGIGDFVGSPFLGKRSDQIGYRRVLLITVLGSCLMFIPQYFVTDVWVFIAFRFGLGLFIGGIIPTANAMIGHLTVSEERGAAFGATSSATSLGNFAGPLLGGLVAAAFSIRMTFLVSAGLFILLWLWIYMRVPEVYGRQAEI